MELLNGNSIGEVTQNNNREKYKYLNEALYKIKDPNYISPYENFTPNDYKPFSNDEINSIYNALREPYKQLADMQGDPKEDWKYDEAAIMYSTVMGTSYQDARSKVNLYYPLISERDFNNKSYSSALWGSVKQAYYNEQLGYATSMFMITKDDYWKKRADDLYEKMMKNRNWQKYGVVGDFFLDNMQGLYSAAEFALVSALTAGIGGAVGASSQAIKWTSWGLNTLLSGTSQQGANTYMLSKMKDKNGNSLFDFDNISSTEQLTFWGGSALMGLIETSLEEIFSPLPKAIRNHFGTSLAKEATESVLSSAVVKTAKDKLLSSILVNAGKNIIGEASEELLQQIVSNGYQQFQERLKNRLGSSFEITPLSDDLIDSFLQGAKGSVLASILSVGSASILNNSTYKKIQKQVLQTQNKTNNSETIFNDFVNTDGYTFNDAEIQEKANEMKIKKQEPINLYKAGDYLGFYTDRKGALTIKANELLGNKIAVEGQVIDNVNHNLSTDKKINSFAKRFNASFDNNFLIFSSQEDFDKAKMRFNSIQGITLDNENNMIKVQTTQGERVFNLSITDETLKKNEEKIRDFVKINNIAKNNSEQKALSSFLEKIYDITKKGKNGNIDKFLNSINFVFDDNTKTTSKGSIEILKEDASGYKKGVIHLTKNSTFETITHELNHYIQNNASSEDLKGFEDAYNINLSDRNIWNKQISNDLRKQRNITNKNYTYAELFANDAEKYYKFGTAQNSKMKSLFSKMKEALKNFANFIRAKKLNDKTVRAFDNLFSNTRENGNTQNSDSSIYFETAEDGTNYDFTDKKQIQELKEKGYILPPREEVLKSDEEIEYQYNQIEFLKANKHDLISQARQIREEYEYINDADIDVNGILTDEDREKINNQLEEESDLAVDDVLFNVFSDKVKTEIGDIDEGVLSLVWRLSEVNTEKEKDNSFIFQHASDFSGLLDFINTINASEQSFNDGVLTIDYNDYGIREDILELKENSPKSLLREAMAEIRDNAREYRIAYEDAEDILNGKDSIQKRAYYRMINSELLDYLNLSEGEDNEIDSKEQLRENITNFRDISNLKDIPDNLRNALKSTEERIRKLTKEIEKENQRQRRKNERKISSLEEEIKKEQEKREKLKKQFREYKIKQEKRRLFKLADKLSKPSYKSHSYKANAGFLYLRLKFINEENSSSFERDLNELNLLNNLLDENYSIDNAPEYVKYLLTLNGLTELKTIDDYKHLNTTFRELRKLARLQLRKDVNERREQIFETRKKAYNEEFGKSGVYSLGEDFTLNFYDKNSVKQLNERINSIEDVNEKKDFISRIKNSIDRLYTATAHPYMLAESIDKIENGTYQEIHKALKENEASMQKSINKRFKKVINNLSNLLKIDKKSDFDKYLSQTKNEEGQEYYVIQGNKKISLNRNEAIMLYGYAIQPEGYQKLIHKLGNNFTEESVNNLINNLLSPADKQLLEILSDDLSSKWQEIARVYARQYNQIMKDERGYFPLFASSSTFSSSVNLDTSGFGMRTTIHNQSRYANKSMTQKRTTQIYSLKLDLWNNYLRGVETQERYIYESDWIRDAQYWISNRGMGTALTRMKGKLWTTTIKNFINDIAEPQAKLNELNNFFSTILNNITVSNLMFNTVSALKQFGAVSAVLTDPNFKLTSFFKAMSDLTFRHKETIEAIKEANPFIDMQASDQLDFAKHFEENKLKRGLNKFKEIGLKFAEFTDLQGRYMLWQSAYQSYIDTFSNGNITDSIIEKAKASANKLIEETQNTTKRSEMSSLQSHKFFLGSDKLAYSNSTFIYLNKFYEMLHLAKNKDARAIGHLSMLLLNAAYMVLLTGVLFKPTDKEYDSSDKAKEILSEFFSELSESFVPLYANRTSSIYDFSQVPMYIKNLINENRDSKAKIKDATYLLALLSKLGAGPNSIIRRVIKGTTDKDSEDVSSAALNTIINLLLGTSFYNNIKGR